jgi:hypothetical protein
MKRSIANEIKSGDQDTETEHPVAEVIAEQGSGVLSDPTPERKQPETALVARYKASRSERAFLPAMSMEVALARRAAIVEFTRKIMVRDQDFGEIPGTSKPTLLKPGAEKLCNFFGLEPEFTPVVDEIDWTGAQHGGETFCYLRYRCRLLRQGRILGVGEGSCNSWESRYRYQWVSTEYIREDLDLTRLLKRGGRRTLCEFEFAIDRAETTGAYAKPAEYWQKFREAITAGVARRVERDTRQGKAPAWEMDADTTLYRIQNPDVADLVNTIQKMAQKRALVAATLIATSASEFFTQDVEDISGDSFGITEADGRFHRKGAAAEHVSAAPVHGEKPSDHTLCKPWTNFGQMRQFFEQIRERVGETRYFEELGLAGVNNPAEFRSANKALECYTRLVQIAALPEVA